MRFLIQFTAHRPAVGRCRLTLAKPMLKAPLVSVRKLHYDEPLSNSAFNFNLRRHTAGLEEEADDFADKFMGWLLNSASAKDKAGGLSRTSTRRLETTNRIRASVW